MNPLCLDSFERRHIGPDAAQIATMLNACGYTSIETFIEAVVPADIRLARPLRLPAPLSETEAIEAVKAFAAKNKPFRSYLGMGYHACIVPPVIARNILENPGWYTQYTPYQAEISQGRLEALINFQTMICDLTGLPVANASLLDEPTAAAEAMAMAWHLKGNPERHLFLVDADCHASTLAVLQTRAKALGIEVQTFDPSAGLTPAASCFGALFAYPGDSGAVRDHRTALEAVRQAGAISILSCDLLALTMLTPPGELGADIAVGSAQRVGVPMGFGGPHAAFMACRDEFKRQMPGRLIGVSRDASGRPAFRLSLQTREQHIRRDKATSNICTAQVLLAVMASFYAIYHGPEGLRHIASRLHAQTCALARALKKAGCNLLHERFFDTVAVRPTQATPRDILKKAETAGINLRPMDNGFIGIALDETVTASDLAEIAACFRPETVCEVSDETSALPVELQRTSPYLTHSVFHTYHSETEFLRYLKRLESRDLSLAQAMIPLGSCTMKLNATTQMLPLSWPEFASLHPFAPPSQSRGYAKLADQLEEWLAEITGFSAVSLQPNAGSQGEYAGLLVIRAYLTQSGETTRRICLIPTSAHGTNPASAVMAGMQVVAVKCDARGDIDLEDLRAKATEHKESLACMMITYPSTHGVFEEGVREACRIIHAHGGQVYMDGANLNAQVGLCRPADIGADVCHMNLHKTFCIPHGGGGPGVGPIAVAKHLAPFLPGHPLASGSAKKAIGPISGAPMGSASLLPIPWAYIAMMGGEGLARASKIAILNANYIARRLEGDYTILYKGRHGLVAHECILDCRPWKERAGVEVEDIAKRLTDYGFHPPTMSWPVPGTLMVEPTESENLAELDRFCEAMQAIAAEMSQIESGQWPRDNNPLKNAPHSTTQLTREPWDRPYSRQVAVFPTAWTQSNKFWPAVDRIDNAYGDRHLFCTCVPVSDA